MRVLCIPDSNGGREKVAEGDDGEYGDELLEAERHRESDAAERLSLLHPLGQ